MATIVGYLPRFYSVFLSSFSSEYLLIPSTYYDELPSLLPKMAILQGTGGCVWNVAVIKQQDQLFFGQGWAKFVQDNSLNDGEHLTFVYDGDRTFEVSVYGLGGCKEIRAVPEVEDLSSEDANVSLELEAANTIPESSRNKGKSIVVVDESDEENTQAFCSLALEEDSDSDSTYSPGTGGKEVATRKKGKSKLVRRQVEAKSKSVETLKIGQRSLKIEPKIKNPEAYLEDPKNPHFETNVKIRKHELLVQRQLVKDYDLEFSEYINYIDKEGELEAKTKTRGDGRIVIKKWKCICERNKVEKEDRILCELLRKENVVYAVKTPHRPWRRFVVSGLLLLFMLCESRT